jgi:hypothetical protein
MSLRLLALAALLSTASAAYFAGVPARRSSAIVQHQPTIVMKDMSPTMRMLRERLAMATDFAEADELRDRIDRQALLEQGPVEVCQSDAELLAKLKKHVGSKRAPIKRGAPTKADGDVVTKLKKGLAGKGMPVPNPAAEEFHEL